MPPPWHGGEGSKSKGTKGDNTTTTTFVSFIKTVETVALEKKDCGWLIAVHVWRKLCWWWSCVMIIYTFHYTRGTEVIWDRECHMWEANTLHLTKQTVYTLESGLWALPWFPCPSIWWCEFGVLGQVPVTDPHRHLEDEWRDLTLDNMTEVAFPSMQGLNHGSCQQLQLWLFADTQQLAGILIPQAQPFSH